MAKGKKTGGRRTKLTPEVREKIVSAIRAGNYAKIAAGYAGIGERTFYRWMELGEAAKSGIYRQFWQAVKGAESEAEVRAVAIIQKHMENNWQAAMTYLERKYPARWGRRASMRLDHVAHYQGPPPRTAPMLPQTLSEEQIRSLTEMMRERDVAGRERRARRVELRVSDQLCRRLKYRLVPDGHADKSMLDQAVKDMAALITEKSVIGRWADYRSAYAQARDGCHPRRSASA